LFIVNDEELLRYSRHILLPQLGIEGQEKLLAARALIIGLGGLGSPAAMYLATSGVGELVLVDDDCVDVSNLHRQIAHTETNVGVPKVVSAKQMLNALNPRCRVESIGERLSDDALVQQIQSAQVVLDCSDNFTTRKQLNALCRKHAVPLISAAAVRLEGQLTVYDFRNPVSPCYECLYQLQGDEDLSCAENGVLSAVVGIVGVGQALEALKIIAGFGVPLVGELAVFNGADNRWRYLKFGKNPQCLCCGS